MTGRGRSALKVIESAPASALTRLIADYLPGPPRQLFTEDHQDLPRRARGSAAPLLCQT